MIREAKSSIFSKREVVPCSAGRLTPHIREWIDALWDFLVQPDLFELSVLLGPVPKIKPSFKEVNVPSEDCWVNMSTTMEYSPLTPSPASRTHKESTYRVSEHAVCDGQQSLGGRYGSIFLSFFVVTLPMLAFSAVLLGLVMKYRVQYSAGPYTNLEMQGFAYSSGSYYVDLSATFLIFVASWSSSVATIAAGFMTALAAYPIAKKYVGLVERHQTDKLLTPYQLALTIRLLDGGGMGALWEWLKYVFKRRGQRSNQSPALKFTSSVALLGAFLA
jgi:uncharacterized membrane protein YecN with MAPEG domain